MQVPKLPENELDRLSIVSEYLLLDTLPEVDYDNITKLVANICNVPVSLITILDKDRNFFKSHHGVPFQESPRDISFCGHAILSNEPIFIVEDARLDERFFDNPLIEMSDAIFYAGVPLVNSEGFALGTLCVFDHQPRTLTTSQIDAMVTLGKQVVNSMELRRKNNALEITKAELFNHNMELKKFASHVSHDLKSPLANIISLTHLMKDDFNDESMAESKENLGYISDCAFILRDYIDGILQHYKADELLHAKKEDVQMSLLADNLRQLLLGKNDLLLVSGENDISNINKSALTQILINLIDNALKYNDKNQRIVKLIYFDELHFHKFSVEDNGIGIEAANQEMIYNLFSTIPHKHQKQSTGIGLSTIKSLVNKLGGDITLTSEFGQGSTFVFTIAK